MDATDTEDTDEQPDTSLSRWLPESTSTGPAGWISTIRADPGRAGVVALGVIGAIAVLVTVLSLIRDRPPAVVSAKLPPVEMVSSTAPTAGSQAPGPAAPVVVSVVGLVHAPGLVTLATGARIADALDAAGGPLDGADVIGPEHGQTGHRRRADRGRYRSVAGPAGRRWAARSYRTRPPRPTARRQPKTPRVRGDSVDLNTATVEQLDALPGVGPVTAAAIVAWRDANGRFASVDQLGDVDGIGPARLDKLRDLVRV